MQVEMTDALLEQWLAALRSGKYVQGRGRMRKKRPSGYKYCCLGVLNELIGRPSKSAQFLCKSRGDNSVLCSRDTPDTFLVIGPDQIRLAQANDGGKSFDEIADMIEKEALISNGKLQLGHWGA